MAPGERDSRNGDPGNPFEAFRRFADEQMASLLNTVLGRPPNPKAAGYSLPNEDLPWIARAMTDEQRQRLKRNVRESFPPTDFFGVPTNEFNEQADKDERMSEQEPVRCPYRPAHQAVPEENRHGPPPELAVKQRYREECPRFEEKGPAAPLWADEEYFHEAAELKKAFADALPEESRHTFEKSLSHLIGRPVSFASQPERERCPQEPCMQPVNPAGLLSTMGLLKVASLEEAEAEARWRALNATTGQPEKDVEEDAYTDDETEGGYRDSYTDGYNNGYGDGYVKDSVKAPTEQDLYEWLLQDPRLISSTLFKRLARKTFEKHKAEEAGVSCNNAPNEIEKPAITSTLTTTERITLPDGTIHTKMVLKKRFADGREESSETTHTTNGSQEQQPKQIGEPKTEKPPVMKAIEAQKPKEKKSGWFWN